MSPSSQERAAVTSRMCAGDLMLSDPLVLSPGTPLFEIVRLFLRARVRGAPVVDERGQVLGVVSIFDVLELVDQFCDDEIDAAEHDAVGQAKRTTSLTAEDVATPEAVWVTPATTLSAVAKLMRESLTDRVLVGVDGRLSGILTAVDLLEAFESDE